MLHKLEDQSQKIANLAKTKLRKYSRDNQELRRQLEEVQQHLDTSGGQLGSQVVQLGQRLDKITLDAGVQQGDGAGLEDMLKEIKCAVTQLVQELGTRQADGALEAEKRHLSEQVAQLTAANEQLEFNSVASSGQLDKERVAEASSDVYAAAQAAVGTAPAEAHITGEGSNQPESSPSSGDASAHDGADSGAKADDQGSQVKP